jgi:hypothetical protein
LHNFGAQPLWNGRDLCNFQLRNVICVFRIAPLRDMKANRFMRMHLCRPNGRSVIGS